MSASIRDVKRRIRSVASTQQMTQAMKTVAVSKHSRAHARSLGFQPYAQGCREILSHLGEAVLPAPEGPKKRICYLVLTANRGLCGSYNLDLMRYLEELTAKETREICYVVCGKWGQNYFAERRIPGVLRNVTIGDIPDYRDSVSLCEYLTELYTSGQVEEIRLVSMRFENVLRQTPQNLSFLPLGGDNGTQQQDGDILFLPDRDAVLEAVTRRCLASMVYGWILSAAEGAHAAMLVAMRSANDSSQEMLQELTLSFNRLRQAAVTTEVLELSGGMDENAGG